jgi:hypothetical protein
MLIACKNNLIDGFVSYFSLVVGQMLLLPFYAADFQIVRTPAGLRDRCDFSVIRLISMIVTAVGNR